MKMLRIRTIGANPNYPQNFELFSQKEIADAIQQSINGRNSFDEKALKVSQSFCDENELLAKYSSGSFIGFKISDDTEDAFLSL